VSCKGALTVSKPDDTPNVRCLVLGIGNLLWADEGFGVRCVEALHERYEFPEGVKLLDGGTQGLYLVHEVQAAERLLVFDAIDYGLKPGTLKVVRGDEVPRFTGAKKMSLHQTGFQDVLSAADLLGAYPTQLSLIGVQAAQLEDYGGSLSPEVVAVFEEALALGLMQLEAWGIEPKHRRGPAPSLLGKGVNRTEYEAGRPPADVAYRLGDARFIPGGL
jgi:hydrogenase maturation protease